MVYKYFYIATIDFGIICFQIFYCYLNSYHLYLYYKYYYINAINLYNLIYIILYENNKEFFNL
jgi:hypothetical protein